MWKCPNCGEEIEEQFDTCWNCGTTQEGIKTKKIKKFTKIKEDTTQREIPNDSQKIPRPTGVTVIFWIMIIVTILSASLVLLMLVAVNFNVERIGSVIFFLIIAVLFQLVIAFGLREGENWARLLYLWLQPIGLLYGLLSHQLDAAKFVFSLIIYLIFLSVLSKREVISFFKKITDESLHQEKSKNDNSISDNDRLLCNRCKFYDTKMGVCSYFHFNVKSYPKKFIKKCNGKFFSE